MQTYLNIAQIVVAVALIIAALLQVRGGGLGGIFGQSDSVFRTRRGVEKALFQLTLIFAVIFIVLALVSVAFASKPA
ncbi:preprotein translocase subunit SecG [Chloroflexota bacterium]